MVIGVRSERACSAVIRVRASSEPARVRGKTLDERRNEIESCESPVRLAIRAQISNAHLICWPSIE